MTKKISIAIVGATGAVGATVLSILNERNFPIEQLYLLASQRSVGESRIFNDKIYQIEDITLFDFAKADIAFFCASNEISQEYAPKAGAKGCVVIDKSSHFRNHPEVPLVVPEVNAHALTNFRKQNIIASPNCSTIPIAVALKPIYDAVGIERINVATYQSVSGTGKEAIMELAEQTQDILTGTAIVPKVYSQQIAFNVIPHIDHFEPNGYTREEMKVVWEMQKIFSDPHIKVNPTAVRVPVFYGHSAAVHVETKEKIFADRATELLGKMPGVVLCTGDFPYPTPIKDAAGKDAVYVGRIRVDISHPKGLNLWIVADNVRKGAALNAVQIAEKLLNIIF